LKEHAEKTGDKIALENLKDGVPPKEHPAYKNDNKWWEGRKNKGKKKKLPASPFTIGKK